METKRYIRNMMRQLSPRKDDWRGDWSRWAHTWANKRNTRELDGKSLIRPLNAVRQRSSTSSIVSIITGKLSMSTVSCMQFFHNFWWSILCSAKPYKEKNKNTQGINKKFKSIEDTQRLWVPTYSATPTFELIEACAFHHPILTIRWCPDSIDRQQSTQLKEERRYFREVLLKRNKNDT